MTELYHSDERGDVEVDDGDDEAQVHGEQPPHGVPEGPVLQVQLAVAQSIVHALVCQQPMTQLLYNLSY